MAQHAGKKPNPLPFPNVDMILFYFILFFPAYFVLIRISLTASFFLSVSRTCYILTVDRSQSVAI
jgi:hypothetical protein